MEPTLTLAITVAFYESVEELQKSVDRAISDSKTVLGNTFQKTEEVRKRYDEIRNHFDPSKSKGKGQRATETRQQEISGFKVLINPTVDYELRLMEESATSLQEKIETFEKVKELYPMLSSQNTKIAMILNDGVPSGFMFFGSHF